MYDEQKPPEIHPNISVHQEIDESESLILPAERCPEGPQVSAVEAVLKKESDSELIGMVFRSRYALQKLPVSAQRK